MLMMEVKRYRPTGFHLFEEESGPVVKYTDHEKAIAASVAAERRRVWDALVSRRRFYLVEQIDISPDDALAIAIKELFPDGEPI